MIIDYFKSRPDSATNPLYKRQEQIMLTDDNPKPHLIIQQPTDCMSMIYNLQQYVEMFDSDSTIDNFCQDIINYLKTTLVNLNQKKERWSNFLVFCALYGVEPYYEKIMAVFVELAHIGKVNLEDKYNMHPIVGTPLTVAIETNNIKLIKTLIKFDICNVNFIYSKHDHFRRNQSMLSLAFYGSNNNEIKNVLIAAGGMKAPLYDDIVHDLYARPLGSSCGCYSRSSK